jgi:hypothetical protein
LTTSGSFGVGGFGVDPAEVSVLQSVGVALEGTSTAPSYRLKDRLAPFVA